MPMSRVLIADCAPAAMQAQVMAFGGRSNPELFRAALRLHQPEIECVCVNVADGETLPPGSAIASFDGVMLTGSPLHIYDPTPAVRNQIDFARSVFAAGVPVWGSCWGVQLATVALGGSVRRNPAGRELGIARRIAVTPAGRTHWLLAERPACFDALCSHLDEVETLPPHAEILAANAVSAVQAMAVVTPVGGTFLGTQYHPEHTLAFSAALIRMRAAALAAEGFGRDEADLFRFADDLCALGAEPDRRDLAWRYGVDQEVLDPRPRRRTAEIGRWLERAIAH
jgi:GMP synthase (glutamine-hydrolysing)